MDGGEAQGARYTDHPALRRMVAGSKAIEEVEPRLQVGLFTME
jgi:hypothetical protein